RSRGRRDARSSADHVRPTRCPSALERCHTAASPRSTSWVRQAGLPKMIDSQLGILKRARPYQDSDHVLNIAYNILCGGQVLDDIEVRRKTPPSWTCWAPARSPTRPRPATSAAASTKRRSGV